MENYEIALICLLPLAAYVGVQLIFERRAVPVKKARKNSHAKLALD